MTKAKSETTAAATTEKPKAAARKSVEKEPVMYVGPTVNGIGIQNRVYTEIPGNVQELFQKAPELKNLFIPVREYPAACRMLRERKGYIYSAFMRALDFKNGGK